MPHLYIIYWFLLLHYYTTIVSIVKGSKEFRPKGMGVR